MPRTETHLQRFDRSPEFRATLYTPTGELVNLIGTTVTITMRRRRQRTDKVSGAAAVVIDPAGGRIQYDWAAADTDEPGVYDLWVKVLRGGKVESYPNVDSHVVKILP